MKSGHLLLLMGILLSHLVRAQSDTYYTKHAEMKLHAVWEGQPITFKTNRLAITLDYETTEILVRLPVSSLTSGIDSLDRWLSNQPLELLFDGKLDLDYINTQKHPPLQFGFEGWLSAEDRKSFLTGKGELYHLSDKEQVACMLGLEALLNADSLGVSWPFPGFEPEFEVQVTKALLRKDKN